MRPLTLTEIEARYNISKEELNDFINEHRPDFPPGCKYFKTQIFNVPLIEYLDKAFNINPDDENSDEAKIQLLTAENSDLKAQIEAWKDRCQTIKNELISSKNELRDFEDKFLSLQDNVSAGNKQVVDKLRNENDTLKNQVANFDKLKGEQLALKDARIKELEEQVADLEESIMSNAALSTEKMKFELRASNLDKKVIELNKKLSSFSDEKKVLENEISNLKESKVITENQVIELEGALGGLIKSILGTVADARIKLESVDKTITTIPSEIKEEVATFPAVEEAPAPIEESETIDTSITAASIYEKNEIRQDDDESEGADATPPSIPSSF